MELTNFFQGSLEARPRLRVGALATLALLAGGLLGWEVVFGSPLHTVAGLLELALVAAILARPRVGLLAFVAVASILPFAVSPVKLFGFGPTLVDLILSSLLGGWLFWAICRRKPILGSALAVPVLLYLGLALASFVIGLTYSISPERLRLFVKSINSTLLFFGVVNCVLDRDTLRQLMVAFMWSGAAAATIALVVLCLPQPTAVSLLSALGPLGYPTGPNVLRPIADTETLRAIGTSIDPNVLGGLLMMVSAVLVGQLFSREPLLARRILLPMAAVVVAALLLTYSRSALGGLVVGATLVGIHRDRRLLLLLAAALLLLPLVPQGDIITGRLQSGLAFEDRAAAMRLDEYRNAINVIAAYPWFGIGFGESPSIDLHPGVSSIYLLLGQEMGLIGLASFLLVLGVLALEIAIGLRAARDEEIRGMLVSLAAALLAAASAGLLDHYFVNIVFPHMVALFWLCIGMGMVAAKLAKLRR